MVTAGRTSKARSEIIRVDVAVIGAGPAGLATAIHLGQLGVTRVLIVDRQQFPRDKICGSAITLGGVSILKQLGVLEALAPAVHWIDSIRVVTPRMREIRISYKTPQMMICSRRILDDRMLRHAQNTGSRFIQNFHVNYLLQRGDRVFGFRSADGREIHADHTVVANGAHSTLGPERGPRQNIQTIMGWWDGALFEPHHMEFVCDDMVKPYYGWLFPESPTRVNIGICFDPATVRHPRELFTSFLQKHYNARLAKARPIGNWKGHPISHSGKTQKLTSPGRIVVGEAARITHPASGEGIYQGLHSGILAGQAIHRIVHSGVAPETALREYELQCHRAFDPSFRLGVLCRTIIDWGGFDILAGALLVKMGVDPNIKVKTYPLVT
jgi:geranylgeranyl reductase family protein